MSNLTDLELNYLFMLQGLLPPGPAWNKTLATYNEDGSIDIPQSNMTSLLSGLAKEFARIHTRISELVKEANPLFSYETIFAKYREAGLPDNCTSVYDPTVEIMRQEILQKWRTVGSASKAFIEDLLSAGGYTSTITEYPPFMMNKPINQPISSELWAHSISINITGVNENWFKVNSGAGDYLHTWETSSVFCYLQKILPAHVYVDYSYTA